MKKFINPLDSISASKPTNEGLDSKDFESESAMMMDDPTICPKCKAKMENVTIAKEEGALWCASGCRVSSPLPLAE